MSITITPNTNVLTLKKGDEFPEVLTVAIPKVATTTSSKIDVYFLTDATSSMDTFINTVKTGAETLLNSLAAKYSDIHFGAGYYTDINNKPQAYVNEKSLTADKAQVLATLKAWSTHPSGLNLDFDESQFYALNSIADPANPLGWRSDAKKILIWFGDAKGHNISSSKSGLGYELNQTVVTDKLKAQNIVAYALSNESGMNGGTTQTTDITTATGGAYLEGVEPAKVVEKILGVVGTATSSIGNVSLKASGDTAGFVASISPAGGKGPIDTSIDNSIPFDVVITGIKDATAADQVFNGSIDVMVDGRKVTEKTVEITVPKEEVVVPPVVVPPVVVPPVVVPPVVVPPVVVPPVEPEPEGEITIDPDTNVLTLEEGALFDEVLKVTIPKKSKASRLDLYFLSDSTGSMSASLANVKDNAAKLLESLTSKYADIGFGVGNYKDFTDGKEKAFKAQQGITTDKAAVISALNGWEASGGGDLPEAQLYALDQIAQPAGGTIGWRRESRRVVLWFGDAAGHEYKAGVTGLAHDVTESSVIAKLKEQGVIVIAMSVKGDGLDKGGAGVKPGQATRITAATGGVFQTGVDPSTLSSRMEELLGKVSGNINKLQLRPNGAINPFIQSISPESEGPISLDDETVVPFDVEFKGVKPALTDRDQVFTGSIDVVADGVVVTKKTVKITVPALQIYRYSIKYVLGQQRPMGDCCEMPILSPGDYRTEINIHNMQDKEAKVEKFVTPLVICGVPHGREPNVAVRKAEDKINLPPHTATMDDGYRLVELLNGFAPCKSQIEDLQLNIGFLEVVSTQELSITAVYTVADLEYKSISIDTQVIPAMVSKRTKVM